MHSCMHACMHVCLYVCMYVGTYVRTYVCMYVCVYLCTCVYVCVYLAIYSPASAFALSLLPSLSPFRTPTGMAAASRRPVPRRPPRPAESVVAAAAANGQWGGAVAWALQRALEAVPHDGPVARRLQPVRDDLQGGPRARGRDDVQTAADTW